MKLGYKIILPIFLLINLYLPLGLVPLFNLDEGAFSEATREMLASGDFITTYLNGSLRFDKPILIYWLQAFSVHIFGLNEFALRLPSAISATVWVYALYYFVKEYFGEEKAFLASFFLASTLQTNIIAKAAIADSLLNMAIACSMFALWLYLDKKDKRFLYMAFACMGIGVLAKGPVAVMIPFVVTFLYTAFKKDLKLFLKMVFDLRGIAIFSIIALPWYILEYLQEGDKFINGFLLKHNIQRFEGTFEGHAGSLFYYIPVLLIGLMPFSGYIVKILKNYKEIYKNNLYLFLAIWFLFVFIFFSFSGTKLPHYIVYGYTPIFIFMALYFKKVDNVIVITTTLFFVLLFFFPEIATLVKVKKEYVAELIKAVPSQFGWKYKAFILAAAVITVSIKYLKIKEVQKAVSVGFLFLGVVNFVIFPRYAKIVEQPVKEAAIIAKKKGYKVIMQGVNTPSFMVYSQMLVKRRDQRVGEILFTRKDYLKNIKNYKTIYKKYGTYLVKVEK